MLLRPGQKWRDPTTPMHATIITIESFDGTTAQGSYVAEGTDAGIGGSAWHIDHFKKCTLIFDPEWPVHRVVIEGAHDNSQAHIAMGTVGIWGGGRSHQAGKGGLGPSVAWWDVAAPSEVEATDRASAAVRDVLPGARIWVDNAIGQEP